MECRLDGVVKLATSIDHQLLVYLCGTFTASSFTIAAEGEILLKPQPFPVQRPPFQARLFLPEDSHILVTFIHSGQQQHH